MEAAVVKRKDYIVHLLESPEGQAALAARGLSKDDLARAIAEFQKRERTRVGTLIGINRDGFFGSKREGWRPEQRGDEPLLFIPWVQILEYLGRVPEGTTGKFLDTGGANTNTLRLSDEIYRATAELLQLTFRTSGTRQSDGMWLVPIPDHLWAELERERRPDESDDEVFMRLVHEVIADIRRSRHN